MFFTIGFYTALIICIAGTLYRVQNWFRLRIGADAQEYSTGQRIAGAFKGIIRTLFSGQLIVMINVLITDILFQAHLYKTNFFRWFMHICIFSGFILLVLMHAFEDEITMALFPDYASTLNPFMFLRNFFGALVLVGLAVGIYRRLAFKNIRMTTNTGDGFALTIIAVIIVSGFFLEGAKIISAPVFDEMVEDYSGTDDAEEIMQLKAYWAKEFGVVFPEPVDTSDREILAQGEIVNEENCASCHSRPVSAFVSYPIAKGLKPAAEFLNETRSDVWFWYIHVLGCFVGLAWLPFGKFFHLISLPVNLISRSPETTAQVSGPGTATMRSLGLDACTHCGACVEHCSVRPVFNVSLNENVLPSEKLRAIKKIASGRHMEEEKLESVAEGSFACTGCYKCTTVCPSGINLQDLWQASKEDLVAKGFPRAHIRAHQMTASEWAEKIKGISFSRLSAEKAFQYSFNLSDKSETFVSCVQCSTCTSVCPVVAATENPAEDLDLTPQQVMNLLRLNLKDMAMGSRMVWNCVTCYMCQEHCPQGVKVTDVMYELRNLSYERFKELNKVKGER
ncbi:MAG: 4Fe-4S dicluster domain-containing protein [Desulfobacterales bacterium]|nr:4Fe-4S dicluster domain-containing protein [Desulfobacterales bacterium]